MRFLYVTGGQQRKNAYDRGEWHAYQRAMVLRVDALTGAVEPCLEYLSPPAVCADLDPSIIFKAATLEGDRLYVCTETELLVYEVPSFRRVGYVSLPCFNDVHHVRPSRDGHLLVAVTGLDMVVEVSLEGRVLREWGVLGDSPWTRFSQSTDYRKVPTTKPHRSHPNYVFYLSGDPWVTRFEQQDAVSLTEPGQRIEVGAGRMHDGVVHGDSVYFTSVEGKVIRADAAAQRVLEVIDLNEINAASESLGWCRGIAVDGDRAWVGFTRFRPTRFRQHLSFIKHGFERVGIYNMLPTRIALYDLAKRRMLQEIDLEPFGLNAVFSIVAV